METVVSGGCSVFHEDTHKDKSEQWADLMEAVVSGGCQVTHEEGHKESGGEEGAVGHQGGRQLSGDRLLQAHPGYGLQGDLDQSPSSSGVVIIMYAIPCKNTGKGNGNFHVAHG